MIRNIDLYTSNQINGQAQIAEETKSSTGFSDVLKTTTSQASPIDSPSTMEDIFRKASDTYQVPLNLLKAVAKTESNFNPNAVSSCGAQGVMQLMPSTAAGLGVQNAFDPEQNIMGGAKYLSQMLDRYDGDIKLTLAAYNAGAGNVAKYGGVPPFKETQAYVKKVTAYMGEDLGTISTTVTKEGEKAPLVFTLKQSDREYTHNDYLRFLDIYAEQKTWSALSSIYQGK